MWPVDVKRRDHTRTSPGIDVSVVIPTHNRWTLLQATLASALQQEAVSFEVIVVDDGSDDETSQRVSRMGDDRVRLVRNERRLGPAEARNRGIDAARTAWIAFLDDDDLWAPEKLRLQLDAARTASASFVYGHAVLIDEDRRVVTDDVPPPAPDQLPRALIQRNAMPAGSSNILVQADLLDRTGRFDKRLRQLADWDMWLRLAEAGRAAVCPAVVVACRRHEANMLLTDRRDVRQEFAYLAAKHEALSRRQGSTFDPVAFSHWVAAGQRKTGRRLAAMRTHLEAAVAYRDLRHFGCALRAPIGDWAMELRQPVSPTVMPPEWLRPHLSW
jgi:glycosyltransferase involved in cell wall biosynthesis